MTDTTIEDALRAYRKATRSLAQAEHDLEEVAYREFGAVTRHMTSHERWEALSSFRTQPGDQNARTNP